MNICKEVEYSDVLFGAGGTATAAKVRSTNGARACLGVFGAKIAYPVRKASPIKRT